MCQLLVSNQQYTKTTKEAWRGNQRWQRLVEMVRIASVPKNWRTKLQLNGRYGTTAPMPMIRATAVGMLLPTRQMSKMLSKRTSVSNQQLSEAPVQVLSRCSSILRATTARSTSHNPHNPVVGTGRTTYMNWTPQLTRMLTEHWCGHEMRITLRLCCRFRKTYYASWRSSSGMHVVAGLAAVG